MAEWLKDRCVNLKHRYIIMAYHDYYPSGGPNDFRASFDSIMACLKWLDSRDNRFEYSHVYDQDKREFVEIPSDVKGFENLLLLILKDLSKEFQRADVTWKNRYDWWWDTKNNHIDPLLSTLGIRYEWYDPDTSYRDDVMACVGPMMDAIKEYFEANPHTDYDPDKIVFRVDNSEVQFEDDEE
ncbi:MAG: hypothetical protein JRZ94_05480 [Nitrososphaerota archaeon]|nr:hypothetical protein [Nitrososphaerota archaeon]